MARTPEQTARTMDAARTGAARAGMDLTKPADPKKITADEQKALLAELEELDNTPDEELTSQQDSRMQEIAELLAGAHGSHTETGVTFWKPEENGTFLVTLLGVEWRKDDLKPPYARSYRLLRQGKEVLLSDSFALRALACYPENSRVILRSKGKEDIGNGKSLHRWVLTPPPPGTAELLPVLHDERPPAVEVKAAVRGRGRGKADDTPF